uniref:Maestro heat-like repeat-containing protein family member 6 n=1 Tax=Taeniopygia guttata TaxID=59729 RepID=A0A674H222_TAEGU
MAGRFLGLFRVFRGKKKKSPEAAPAQEHENPEQFQPLQDNAALDRTQEKKPARGRFRKTLKTFWKFPCIRRRKTGSAAAEGPAEPGSGLTELQAEPDVSPDLPERSENSDTSVTETRTKILLTSMTEDVDITNAKTRDTQGIANTDTMPSPTLSQELIFDYFKDPCVPSQQQEHENPEQFQPLQDNAALDRTQEKKPARGRFRKTLKMFWKFPCIPRRKTGSAAAEGPAEPGSGLTELQAEPDVSPESTAHSGNNAIHSQRVTAVHMAMAESVAITNTDTRMTQGISKTGTMPTPTVIHAPTTDFLKESAVPSQQQVPAIVRNIHQRLMSQVTVDIWLQIDILRLAEEHPADLVLTLLRCAPACDRAAAMMWRTIGSSSPTVEKVLPTLLCVMENWPLHSMCTSDGDNEEVFALAATLVLWVILQVPKCHEAMNLYSSHLFVALLFHLVITTQQIPSEEVATFWRACWEEHRLHCKPNRFVVQTMKALLCRLQWDHVVLAMERKRGWDTLLCAETQHYAVGLLARVLCHVLDPFCSHIAFRLLRPQSREEPCWDLPSLAFLVEVLGGLDLSECGDSVLEMMSRYLRSECRERRRLALRGLVVLTKDPSMARRMYPLSQSLLELLGDADGEVVSMSLRVFTNVLQHKDILVSSTTAPKLAEALLLLFDHDSNYVLLLSIQLFDKMMNLVVDEGKKPMKKILCQSLLPLFLHCHEDNQRVANASRETLLGVAEFLKKRNLKKLLKKEQLSKFAECLLAEDSSSAAEHLRRALPYLQSPQEPLREAAVRFMGMAGRYLKGQPAELHLLTQALEAMSEDDSPSSTNLEIQEIFGQRCEELRSSAGFREPRSQEEYQETVKRAPGLNVTGAPGTPDAGHSCACCKLP